MTEDNPVTITADPRGREVIIARVFDAPRELVFKTCTDPNLIQQWWGPKEYSTAVDEMDVRFGGVWRYVQRGPDGNEFAFKGVYHTVMPPERLAYTFEFEGMPGHVMLETAMFEEQGGKTTMTVIDVFQTVEDRDGALQSGMKDGATESMDRFAKLLQNSRATEKASTAALEAKIDPASEELEPIGITPKKTDIVVQLVSLVWAPYRPDDQGRIAPAW